MNVNFQPNPNMQMPMPMQMASSIPQAPVPSNSQAVLYVGNLDQDLGEQRLFEYFSQYGPVANVHICRDMYTGESRGFAFVTYRNRSDAERAKLVLNHTKIQTNELNICFKRNASDINANANCYVSNLDSAINSRELEEICSDYGKVLSCIVRTDREGNSLRYGYVQFDSVESAESAIAALNGKQIHESEVSIAKFLPKSKRANPNQKCNLYIKNFPASFSQEQVEEFINNSFGEFGEITSKGIFSDQKLGRFYAFVAYKSAEDAGNAVSSLNGHEFEGEDSSEQLYVDFAMSKIQRKRLLEQQYLKQKNQTNLYVRSIKLDVTEEQLRSAFEKYGEISSVSLKRHKFNARGGEVDQSKELQFGFLNFPNPEDAKRAFTEGKADADVLALVDQEKNKNGEFIFYAVLKKVRNQFLRVTKKNNKSTQFLMYKRFLKMMMGQNNQFQRGGRGRGGPNPQQILQNMMMNPQMMNMPQGGAVNPMMMMPNPMQQMMMAQQAGLTPQQMIARQQALAAQKAAQGVAAAPAQNVRDVNWLKHNIAEFNAYDISEQKQLLGTLMYAKVASEAPLNLVPKITGMLIDLDVLSINEIVEILENEDVLRERIEEAKLIIEEDNEAGN